MSDNNLLREGTIRRFMKLANVDTLTNNFINEKYAPGKKGQDDPDEALEEQDMPEPEMEDEEMELDLGEEDPVDMDAEAEPAEMGEADISLTEEEAQLLIDLGERLKEAMGPAAEDDMMDDMADEEMADDEMAEVEPPEAEEPEADPEALQESRDEIVKEVLRRVTKRILQQKAAR